MINITIRRTTNRRLKCYECTHRMPKDVLYTTIIFDRGFTQLCQKHSEDFLKQFETAIATHMGDPMKKPHQSSNNSRFDHLQLGENEK